jgi:pimeloyl-ACP methyl ester carboxylesterase
MATRLRAVLGWAFSALLTLSLIAAAALLWLCRPLGAHDLAPNPRPAGTYEEALARFERMDRAEPPEVNPVCHSRLLTHGHRTGRAILLFHGFTNCPRQFESLAEVLYARGANVLIVRAPYHGLRDVLSREPQRLTSEELAAYGDAALDVARGLGDNVTVAGLSMGANVAAWLAQERADVDRAVVIAPLFGVASVWRQMTPALERGLLVCPDRCVWWSDKEKARVGGPRYAYPRFSTKALGQALRMGLEVAEAARARPPRAGWIVMVTIEGDPAVRNDAAAEVRNAWSLRAPGRVEAYEFPIAMGLGHDLIDPLQPYQKVDRVYPVLAEMMWPK